MSQETIEKHFVAEVMRRSPAQLSGMIAEKVASRLTAAPTFNGRGQLVQLYALSAPAIRWSALALGSVGDETRARLTSKITVIDTATAAEAEANLGEYAGLLGSLDQVGPVDLRPPAEVVLLETQRLLAIVATGEPRLHDVEWPQSKAGAEHAAAALVAAFDMGLLLDGLPSEVLGALHAMEHVVH
ncbi:MAG: hypothetical protein ACHQCH_03975 [Solirubrobacterales bacterium]